MTVVSGAIVGREEELRALADFLGAASEASAAAVIVGDSGIGKTTLWRAAVVAARERGLRVLCAAPAAAEAQLSFAALRDLLDGVPLTALAELPTPQRHALEVALLRAEAEGPRPNPGAIGTALLNLLRVLASDTPVLLAIDDVQWLDAPSEGVLEFAARRLGEESVALLLAQRIVGAVPPLPLGVERAFDVARLFRLVVGPLSLGAVQRMLGERLGTTCPHQTLRRLHEVSGGNPFYALELGRELLARGVEPSLHDPLPIPQSLDELLRARLARLPVRARNALLVAAALRKPSLRLLERAEGERVLQAIEQALRAHIVELENDRVHFTHPLLASFCYGDSPAPARRAVHRRLAELVSEPEERARHLALAAEGPNAEVAAALDEAAQAARARGAPATAGELCEAAIRLTPSNEREEAARRHVEAARSRFAAGDSDRARELLERALEQLGPGDERARALLLLAQILHECAEPQAPVAACERALLEPIDDPGLRIEAYAALGFVLDEDNRRRIVSARQALALLKAERGVDPHLEAFVLKSLALSEYYVGSGVRVDLFERAAQLEAASAAEVAYRASTLLGECLKYADDLDGARERLEAACRDAQSEGDEGSLPDIVAHLCELELWAGNWSLADHYATESLELAERTEQRLWLAINHYSCGLVDAHLGRIDSARVHAERGLAMGEAMRSLWVVAINLWVLGFLDLSTGELAAADRHLSRADEIGERIGLVEPGQWRFHADHIEALVGLGELERAAALCARLEERGRAVDRPWALATAARCRGLIAAAQGDLEAAVTECERALVEHGRLPVPFERARTLLVLGQVERRARRKRAARESLAAALAVFEQLGAPLWVKRARAELARIGGRTPAGSELTASEARVAALVAQGRTNKEAAAELFLSVNTVETTLRHVYAKLGVRSRAELARRFALG